MYEQHCVKDIRMDRGTAMTMKSNNMKCGWHQMINNTVHYYQTACNITLIVKQLSSYDSVLREQIETKEDIFLQLKHKNSNENRHETKLSASSIECFPKRRE